jgi:hypothetical protein
MPVVPGFTHDLFVSYAHLNNRPLSTEDRGWVTEFVETLRNLLEQQSRDFTLWEDKRLVSGELWDETIPEAVQSSAVLLVVFSPSWIDSSYCRKELELFRGQRHPAFGWQVRDSGRAFSRIQGLVLQNVPLEQWPPELKAATPVRFATGTIAFLSKPARTDMKDPYFQESVKIAESVWATIEAMRKPKQDRTAIETMGLSARPQSAIGSPIFLAEVTDDLYEQRERLEKWLGEIKTFELLPASTYEESIGRAGVSVHFFSEVGGRPAPGKEFSLPRLQLEWARQHLKGSRPVVWLPKGLDLNKAGEGHRKFLTSLEDGSVELLRIDFEDLKSEVQKKVAPKASPLGQTMRIRRKAGPLVYISALDGGNGSLKGLKEKLVEADCGVSCLDLSDETEESRNRHLRNLRTCDGLVVPYTAKTQSRAEDLVLQAYEMMRQFDRPRAIAAVEVLPAAAREFGFVGRSVVVVRNTNSEARLDEFLEMIDE